MDHCDWAPFFKATFERNPVALEFFRDMEPISVSNELSRWPDESIYSENRLALPDEVVNFRRGDGIEKAITLIHVLKSRHMEFQVQQTGPAIEIHSGKEKFSFRSNKTVVLPEGGM